jgi:hypothetical protein
MAEAYHGHSPSLLGRLVIGRPARALRVGHSMWRPLLALHFVHHHAAAAEVLDLVAGDDLAIIQARQATPRTESEQTRVAVEPPGEGVDQFVLG